MSFSSHDSAHRTLRIGWRVLVLWACGVPGTFLGLIAGKLFQRNAAFFSFGRISLPDIFAQLAMIAIPAVILIPITWLLLALLQRFALVDVMSRTRAAWFALIGLGIGLLWGANLSFESGPFMP